MSQHTLSHLKWLEAESIHIIREVAAEFDNPVMLYSIGKDSSVMVRLAQKAFHPAPIPFPMLLIKTTWEFTEMIEFGDKFCKDNNFRLIVQINEEALKNGANPLELGSRKWSDLMLTTSLVEGLKKGGFDAAFGGGRRDEEKSRAKERVYSFRDKFSQWDPKNQRPELWNLYNGKVDKGEHVRVFPLSNWTEQDIWQYIHLEKIPIVPLYYAGKRPCIERDGQIIYVNDDRLKLRPGEVLKDRMIRFRTLGDWPFSGAMESDATTLPRIIQEMLLARNSERQGRMVDYDTTASMEQKKRQGYF